MENIKILDLRYTKISAIKMENFKGELKISPNINIKNIDKIKSESKNKQEVLKTEFQFNIDYNELGKIEIEGNLFLSVDAKTSKTVLDEWKNKKLSSEINVIILNIIMQKASIKAIQLEEEINLPPHIQLPRLQIQKNE